MLRPATRRMAGRSVAGDLGPHQAADPAIPKLPSGPDRSLSGEMLQSRRFELAAKIIGRVPVQQSRLEPEDRPRLQHQMICPAKPPDPSGKQ